MEVVYYEYVTRKRHETIIKELSISGENVLETFNYQFLMS